MKNPLIIGVIVIVFIFGFAVFNSLSQNNSNGTVPTSTISITEGVNTTPTKGEAPLPQETDIIRTFINLIDGGKASEAVMMMPSKITNDDSTKQAFGVQYSAMESVKVLKIEDSSKADWTEIWHQYMVSLDVVMNPNSSGGPIPYYGFEKGENIRFITLIKEGGQWKIEGLATGP